MRPSSDARALALVLFVLLGPLQATAVTITVDTTTDELNADGDCSLREALQAANTNLPVDACPAGSDTATDEVVVPAGTYTLSGAANEDVGQSGDLDILANTAALDLIVTGADAATTIIQACTTIQTFLQQCAAGQGTADRVFNVRGAAATFRHLTMRHGYGGTGGAVYGTASPGLITIDHCILADNYVGGDGGAVRSTGDVTIVDSTIRNNRADTRGGGIFVEASVLEARGTTWTGNFAVNAGGAIMNSSNGAATIVNSTISGNATGVNGGGVFSFNDLTVENCTITGNTASTQASGHGGGLYVNTAGTVRNSILAGNIDLAASNQSPDCYGPGTIGQQAFNLVGDGNLCTGITHGANGSKVGTAAAPLDAKLGPLADNGGPTATHAPASDSPAVGAGSPALPGGPPPACAPTDQRGIARPQGAVCDMGAVETTDVPSVVTLAAIQPSTGGNAGTVGATLFGNAFAPGATVRLTRVGAADIVGLAPGVAGTGVLLTTFDLTGAAPGAWSVVVTNPDATSATLTDGFTVAAGGASELWASVLTRRQLRRGRLSTLQLVYGNRGTVDAYGVPFWISFPDDLLTALRFVVDPPPVHVGQPATDWTRVGITMRAPDGPDRRSIPLLLPVVPAGFSGVLTLRLLVPASFPLAPFTVTLDIGDPIFAPTLSAAVTTRLAADAKARATAVLDATTLPSDATIEAYVADQLEAIRAAAAARWRSALGNPPVFSLTHLLIDASQFAAAAGGNLLVGASAMPDPIAGPLATVGRWLEHALLGATVQARLIDADCFSPPFYGVCPEPDCVGFPEQGECEPEDFPPCDQARPYAPCNPDDPGPTAPPLDPVDSRDPNDKVGPGGDQGYVDGVTPLPYAVYFENVATASAPAQEVVITDQLDGATLDLATFALGPIGFGDTIVVPPPGLQTFATDVDLRPGRDLIVRIEAGLDTGSGVATWRFTSLDPATGELPEDPQAGFLPANVTPPEGDGSVLFTISPKGALPLGTVICNDARIVFDLNAPIDTPEWCNTIGIPPRPEDCENCLDDDLDGTVDRADHEDCAPRADGGGAGVAPETVKPFMKCAKALRKVGAKLASDRITRVSGCLSLAADCIQLKLSAAACTTVASAKCAKLLATATANATAMITKLEQQCAPAAATLGPLGGLGFTAEIEACAARGVTPLDTTSQILECVRRRQACTAERVIGAAVPRAAELLSLAGRTPALEFPCLPTTTGNGAAAADRRKAVRKCDAALQKATAKLVAGRTAVHQSCAAAALACLQEKPGNEACRSKAQKTCAAARTKRASLDAKFATTVSKACGAAPLEMTDLLAPEGLAALRLAESCAAFGIPALQTPAALASCLSRQIACRTDQLAESATPRFHELLDFGGLEP